MSKTIKVDFEGTVSYPRVKYESRDTGENLRDGDQKTKLEECQGQYTMSVFITPETKKQMIANGVPTKGMTGQLFKEDDDGNLFYKCTRKHFNPKLQDKETGEQGVVMGPPKVIHEVDGANVAWDFDTDGEIGNGSQVKVRLSIWDKKIVEMEAIKILELVEWEGSGNSLDDM